MKQTSFMFCFFSPFFLINFTYLTILDAYGLGGMGMGNVAYVWLNMQPTSPLEITIFYIILHDSLSVSNMVASK